ncbi:MAG: biotin--[acetyl-CoA-carboxylase] ligase [Gemmatimonadota bacterium]|nr:biotin--[acetyl-CoA-carboxylase] ligase [Gemmatimonadota bacterium]
MSASARYDGRDAGELRALLDLPEVALFDDVPSTLDVAHGLAAGGASSGTLVLADAQSAGRGRNGRAWSSARGAGIWLTLIERPRDPAALQVLSIRLGLRAAAVLDRFAGERVSVKWPNDLFVGSGKLAGILVESRWREDRIDWVAIGFGVNVKVPAGVDGAASLTAGTDRVTVLAELVPALRAAASASGELSDREMAAWRTRDLAAGRSCSAPARGIVHGIDARGSLLVRAPEGGEAITCRAGSLVLEDQS